MHKKHKKEKKRKTASVHWGCALTGVADKTGK